MRMLIIYPIVLLFLVLTIPRGLAYHIKNYDKKDYGAEYQNWAIDKGNDQFMYFANNAGLLVFDGVSWQLNTSPLITNIRAVKRHPGKDLIYTAGYNEMGYWEKSVDGSLQYTSLTEKFNIQLKYNEEFWNIIIDNQRVIFHSFHVLYILENDSFKEVRSNHFITDLTSINGEVYALVRREGIYRLNDDKLEPYITGTLFNDKYPVFLFPWENDSWLIGTSNHGIFIYYENAVEQWFPYLQDEMMATQINCGKLSSNGDLIIGTLLNGVFVIPAIGEPYNISTENGLQNNTVLDIYSDGPLIWASLDRGISLIKTQPDSAVRIHKVSNIGATYAAAIFEGQLYLGTNQGLYKKYLNEPDNRFRPVENIKGQVWNLTIIDDHLFVGHNSGTFTIKNNTSQKISSIGGAFNFTTSPTLPGLILQSTYSMINIFHKTHQGWALKHSVPDFYDLLRYIEVDYKNNIWASHMRKAIYKITTTNAIDSITSIRYYDKTSPLAQDFGIGVFNFENQIVFTTGTKIFTYDHLNQKIIPYDQINNQVGDFARSHKIVSAPNSHYWFIAAHGYALYASKGQQLELVKAFPAGLFDSEFIEGYENITPIDQYKAIFCMANGYAIIDADPEIEQEQLKGYQPILRKISSLAKNESFPLKHTKDQSYYLKWNENNLIVQYSFSYYRAKKLTFTYYVEGLSDYWSIPAPNAEIEINRIPPGKYTIKMVAQNEWGRTSDPHILHFTVAGPWYANHLAIAAYAISFIFLIFFISNHVIAKIQQKEQQKAFEKEQELIKLRNENLSNELEFKSRELAGSTMLIIKKNEFLLDLKKVVKKQKDQLGSRYPDKFYNSIVKSIDSNISGGDDWKIFEANIEKSNESFMKNLHNAYPTLTPSDLRLCTYLKMNLTTKEIAPLMHISVRGVENHRYMLRKKLNLSRNQALSEFILAFE